MRSASATVRCARCSTSRTVTPALADRGERLEDDVDDRRREPERRLVEQQHVGRGDERARDRELLLLAARERARVPRAELRDDREELVDRARRPSSAPSRERRPASPSRRFSSTVRSGEDATALGHERDRRCARRPRDGGRRASAPPSRTSPPRAGTAPMIACSVDDLPAPFGPISPTISPGATSSDEAAHGGTRAVAHLEPSTASSALRHRLLLVHGALAEVGGGDVEVGADLRAASLGERPALVEHVDAVADVHDQRHVVVDQQDARARGRRARRGRPPAKSGTSASGRPAAGSSMSTNFGSVASARATPSRRSSPCASAAAGAVGDVFQAEQREQRVRSPPGVPRGRADSERSHLDVLAHRELPERVAVLKGPREPAPARDGAALHAVTSRPSSSTEPAVGQSKPVSTLTSVDLPAPFGPISPTTSCRWSSRVTPWSACTPSNERDTAVARSVPPGHRSV